MLPTIYGSLIICMAACAAGCKPVAADVETAGKPERPLRRHTARQERLEHGASEEAVRSPAALQQRTQRPSLQLLQNCDSDNTWIAAVAAADLGRSLSHECWKVCSTVTFV